MPEEKKQTTVMIDTETRDELKAIALLYQRSMAGQIRHWVDVELGRISGGNGNSPTPQPAAEASPA